VPPIAALLAAAGAQGVGPYTKSIQTTQDDINGLMKKIEATIGIKESDTGLAPPSQWDLVQDKQMMQEEQPLQVARCTKIISPNTEDAKYVINVRQIAKFVVGLGDRVAPADIEEGMRVGVDRTKYQIQIPLPPKVCPRGRGRWRARQAYRVASVVPERAGSTPPRHRARTRPCC